MATRKHKSAKQTSKKADDPVSKLNQQWKKHGVVIMDSTFLPMSQEMFNYLCEEAEDLDDPIFIDPNVGESQRVNQKLYVDPALEKNSAAKKLLLGSGDNDMATAIDRYVQTVLGSKIVYGAKNESPLSSFVSLLKCIDNVPAHYRVEDFAREVLQLLVNTPEACAKELKAHLHKTTRSYKKLILDLANEEDMNSACDFYLGAASMLIEKPIMLIKPKQVKLAGGRVTYEFFQEYLLESDRNLQDKDFKIRLIFNGVNHYAPFFPKELGDVINTGYKTLKKVREVYQDVKQVIGKIPTKAKINGALQQMSIHLRAAAQIAETVRFECGVGDTTAVSQLPVPLQTGATEPILRK